MDRENQVVVAETQTFVDGDKSASQHRKHLLLGDSELLLDGLQRNARFPRLDVLGDRLYQRRTEVLQRILAKQRRPLRPALTFDLPLMDDEKSKTGPIAKPSNFSKTFFLLLDSLCPLYLEDQALSVGEGQ
jgi:hypothetical protein